MIETAFAELVQRQTDVARLATMNKLPSVGPTRIFAESGGLVSYGANFEDQFRRAANYSTRRRTSLKRRARLLSRHAPNRVRPISFNVSSSSDCSMRRACRM